MLCFEIKKRGNSKEWGTKGKGEINWNGFIVRVDHR